MLIKNGDFVKDVTTGEIDIITDIQYVYNRYQVKDKNGWIYGIKNIVDLSDDIVLAEIRGLNEKIEELECEVYEWKEKAYIEQMNFLEVNGDRNMLKEENQRLNKKYIKEFAYLEVEVDRLNRVLQGNENDGAGYRVNLDVIGGVKNKYKNTLTGKINYLLGHHDEDGTHLYHLTRVKEAFNIGTMTLDDFVEVDENLTEELVELFLEENKKLVEEIKILNEINAGLAKDLDSRKFSFKQYMTALEDNQQCENDKQLYLDRLEYYESETERLTKSLKIHVQENKSIAVNNDLIRKELDLWKQGKRTIPCFHKVEKESRHYKAALEKIYKSCNGFESHIYNLAKEGLKGGK